MNLTSKIAIVTGGASGFGAATALRLAQAGARVMVADLNAQGAQAIAEQVTRQQEDFELLLVSGSGRVWSFEKAITLLPLAFGTI